MKTLLLAAVALIAAAQISSADFITDLLGGKWRGNVDVISGLDIVPQRTSIVCKRGGKGSYLIITTVHTNGVTLVGKSYYRRNGKVDGTLRRGGVLVAVMSGKWSSDKDSLTSNVTATGMFPTFKSRTTMDMVFGEVLLINGRSSTGEITSGIMKRK